MKVSFRAGSLYVLAAGVLWGTTGTAQALAPAGAQPLTVGAFRLLIAGAALVPIAYARRALPTGRRWPRLPTGLAVASMAAYQPLFFAAVAGTGVAVGTIVAIGSAPIIAGALAWIVSRERPSGRWAVATALAILGISLLFYGRDSTGADPVGIVLALGAGLAYAVYVISSKELLDDHGADAVIAVVFGLSGLLLLPILVFADVDWVVSVHGALLMLYLGLVATALAYTLFARGLQILPVNQTVTLSLVEPLTAAALGILVLGEQVSPQALVGGLLLLIGLGIVSDGRIQGQNVRPSTMD